MNIKTCTAALLFLALAAFAQTQDSIVMPLFAPPTLAIPAPPEAFTVPAEPAPVVSSVPTFSSSMAQARTLADSLARLKNAQNAVLANAESLMPPLTPKGEFEKQAEFEARAKVHEEEKNKKVKEEQKRIQALAESTQKSYTEAITNAFQLLLAKDGNTDVYKARLDTLKFNDPASSDSSMTPLFSRAAEVLQDYIVQQEAQTAEAAAPGATLTLGQYDAEKEQFQMQASDTESQTAPFIWSGTVAYPIDSAKTLDKANPGLTLKVQYLNSPFSDNDLKVNLAMKALVVERNAKALSVQGQFESVPRFALLPGYAEWKAHADSLLQGTLKAKGLTADYALKGVQNAGIAEALDFAEVSSPIGWKTPTRIVIFALAAACVGGAVWQHLEASEQKDAFNKIAGAAPADPAAYDAWYAQNYAALKKHKDDASSAQNLRTIFGASAGVLAVGGALTFVF
jgi:hypothetical protein